MTKKPLLRVAYLGDSHCGGGAGGIGTAAWRHRMTAFFLNYFEVVEAYHFCVGGETIGSSMPDGYVIVPPFDSYINGTPIVGRNITAALAVNPDLILFLHSGNHFANGFTLDYVKLLYADMVNVITTAGKKFAFSSAGPRSTYFPGPGVDVNVYRTLCQAFNVWLKETYPDNNFDIWETLTDPLTGLPYTELLLGDNLHYNAEGHLRMKNATVKFAFPVDEVVGYDKIIGYNLKFIDNGSTVTVQFGETFIKYITISTSTDGINFTQQATGEFTEQTDFLVNKAPYVKVVIANVKGDITVTKHFE